MQSFLEVFCLRKKRNQFADAYKIEVVRLRRENKRLRMEREILKNSVHLLGEPPDPGRFVVSHDHVEFILPKIHWLGHGPIHLSATGH